MKKSKNQSIVFEGISFTVKREDQLHPDISGNKYRKLKYNILEAKKQKQNTLLTFGGAFSNHIAATAAAGKEYGLNTIGVIRGEELATEIASNHTLNYAQQCGMQLVFVSREAYREKNDPGFVKRLEEQYGAFYCIPEGGTNALAVKGCKEILTESDAIFDTICTSVGTGGTIAGLIHSAKANQKTLGFSALRGDFLNQEIKKHTGLENWELVTDYHFGGYGKIKPELITFINQFKEETGIPLDPIYTGKMCFGIVEMFKLNKLEPTRKVLMIHTGGLQGIAGINEKLKRQNSPLIV